MTQRRPGLIGAVETITRCADVTDEALEGMLATFVESVAPVLALSLSDLAELTPIGLRALALGVRRSQVKQALLAAEAAADPLARAALEEELTGGNEHAQAVAELGALMTRGALQQATNASA